VKPRRALWAAALLVASTTWLIEGQSGLPREDAYRHNNLGVAHLERYDFRAAADAFRQALTIDPNLTIARLNLAIARLYDGDHDGASIDANAVVAALPRSPHGHYVAGLIARAANRTADAAAAFQRTLDIDPEDVGTRIQLAQIHTAERRYAEATSLFDAALAREPFNATAAYGLATALVRAGQRAAGEAAMARFQALRDNPSAVTYSNNYLEQGRYSEALASTGLEVELVDPAAPAARFIDATAAMFGESDPHGRVALLDADRDGDLDGVLASASGLALLINDEGRFARRRSIASMGDGVGAVGGDYDNDGRPDIFVVGRAGNRLFRQQPDGSFNAVPVNAEGPPSATAGQAGVTGDTATAAFADIDHDGDLDLFLSSPNRLLRNNGNGTFSETAATTGLAGTLPLTAVIPTDYDNRRDIDVLLVPSRGALALFANRRDGTFQDVARQAGLPGDAAYTAAATGDLNKDGASDFIFATSSAPAIIALSTGRGRFSLTAAPNGTASATAVQLFDYDSDGLPDLLAFTPSGARLWRYLGSSWSDVTSSSLPTALSAPGDIATTMAIGDVDADGDYDVIAQLQSGRVQFWRNTQPSGFARPGAVRVRLDARVSNRSAIGAKVELRAGSLRDRFEVSAAVPPAAPADIVFGIGRRARADVIRVLWPSGILQAEADPASAVTIVELDRKPSSCPFLFTWNGTGFEFVTDFMGGGEMGAWVAPGIRNAPDPDEYVRLRRDQLSPLNGRYELRMTNELEEALFVDRIQLVSVAHASSVEVFPNEGLRSPGERRPFTIYTVHRPRPPAATIDHHGHDMLDAVRSIDGKYVDDFRLKSVQGYAEPHSLTLNLGHVPSGSPLRLLFTGWTDYAFSSDNVAAYQAGLPSEPPALQIRDADDTWRTIVPELGIPVGRPQTIVADLTRHVPRGGGHIEVRVTTSMRVYWDQILMDTSAPAAYDITRLDVAEARLRWRGFSAEISPDGLGPLTYDYDRVSSEAPWKTMPGLYTREGDVRALLRSTDDRFVVAAPGDEIALAFEASKLPALPAGWTRTFLLYVDGFSKEMNLHSASPDRLEPLPFHAMSRYPYRAPEFYPRTRAHDRYRAEYNTRAIGGPLPPMTLGSRAAAR
jgi:tetratricopeptide (TPR) repeat protein